MISVIKAILIYTYYYKTHIYDMKTLIKPTISLLYSRVFMMFLAMHGNGQRIISLPYQDSQYILTMKIFQLPVLMVYIMSYRVVVILVQGMNVVFIVDFIFDHIFINMQVFGMLKLVRELTLYPLRIVMLLHRMWVAILIAVVRGHC